MVIVDSVHATPLNVHPGKRVFWIFRIESNASTPIVLNPKSPKIYGSKMKNRRIITGEEALRIQDSPRGVSRME